MRVIYLDLNDEHKFNLAISEAVQYLKEGKIIIYPTDTIYGMGCDAFCERAIDKIFSIKGRENMKPLSILVKDIEEIRKYSFVDSKREKIISALLPGPFTLILPEAKNIPKLVTGGKNAIGVRIPDNPITKKLLKSFERPIVSTSVNISGREPLSDPFKIVEEFKIKKIRPDLILDCGKIPNARPSVIVDITRENPQIKRSEILSVQEVRKLLQKLSAL
ncbi:MAG: L-threonylcarbamoyladenylate synthase [Candidatus Moranbacteria bacterium]|nr:L-threonylcarbamoyladenylate synthase [Candidatus Moranbacteria bacterium]